MAATAMGNVDSEQLLASIYLLRHLNDTFQEPTTNILEDAITPNRVLSLRQEQKLAETLAFLAATTDDPAKVSALVVEEMQDGKGMTIRIAVNNGGLQKVKDGFENLARILQDDKCTKNGDAALLQEVVSLNHNRILVRIRSGHAKLHCNFKKTKKSRPKVLTQLAHAVARATNAKLSNVSASDFATLKCDVERLNIIFLELERMTEPQALTKPGLNLLIKLVKVARRLHSGKLLQLILDLSGADSGTTRNLAMAISKLGRYVTACKFLNQAARTLSIFTNIRVSVVKLVPQPRVMISDPRAFVMALTDSLFNAAEVENAMAILRSRLKKGSVRFDVESFLSGISSIKFVVHAEIQLLFYYELNDFLLLPRVICSTKKACFLCDLLIRLHGRFVTPSTHGRLYEKWTLPREIAELRGPRAEQLSVIIQQFYDAVQNALRNEVLAAKKPYPAPYESAIFVSPTWTPLIRSQILPSSSYTSPPGLVSKASGESQLIKEKACVQPIARSEIPADRSGRSINETTQCSRGMSMHSCSYLLLMQGEELEIDLSLETIFQFGTESMHLMLSYETRIERETDLTAIESAEVHTPYWARIRWLMNGELPDSHPNARNVNLDDLKSGSEITFDQGPEYRRFYIIQRKDLISIETLD